VHRFKQFLKRSSLLLAVNARVKARALRRARQRLIDTYAAIASERGVVYDAASVAAQVHGRIAARGTVAPLPPRPKILWVGADINQDLAGFLPALEARADVVRFHRSSGEYGERVRSADGIPRPYDADVVALNDADILRTLREARYEGAPFHMLLGQMWAHTVSTAALQEAQRLGCVTVNVSMDDRLPELWSSWRGHRLGSVGLIDGLDLVLTTSSECCLWYTIEGCPALWWPLASDPAIFTPRPESGKRYDISFVGSRYGVRAEIVESLLAAGIDVAAFGPGWPRGPVPVERVAEIFAESRIILGIGTIAHNRDIFTIKLRDFDAPMAGALYITHRNPDLSALFEEDREIVCYGTMDELRDKVRHYLSDTDARATIAAAGRRRAEREHTWQRRFDQMFAVLPGGLSPS
jgi:spore maturation protein CgeB